MAKEPIDIDPAGRPGLPGVEILASVKDVPRDVISQTVQETPKQGAATGPPSPSFQDTLIYFVSQAADEFEAWGQRSSKVRDKQLRAFIGTESQFTSALGIVITRNSAFNWELEGSPLSVERVHQILTEANMGEGWENFIAKLSIDLYTQDAGAFVEIVRDGELPTSPLIGINHLDAARCWHTGDPMKPVIYQDIKQEFHLLNWWNVATLSEMPTAIEGKYGLQWCAETRLMMAAQIMRNIAIYKKEKSGGRNTRAIHLVQGLTTEQVNDAIGDLKNRADAEGFMRYMQPVVIGSHDPQATLDVKTLELASLPDGFDDEKSFNQYANMIAMAFQSDLQEFVPLPGGNLGTSMQSQVLHMKSRGKGPGLFMKLIKNMMNNRILPKNVHFSFEEQDLDAEQAQADISKTRAEARKMRIESRELLVAEARQIAVDEGDLPQALFEATPATDISPPERVVTQEGGPAAEEDVGQKGELEVSPTVDPFGLQMTEIGIRQTEPARAGPFEDDRLKAERRLERALNRAFRQNFDAVKKRLRRENRATKEIRYKQLGDLLDDTEFWGLRKGEFFAEVGDQPLELLLDGGQQAERLGLTFDFNLVNQDALRKTQQFTNRWWQELSAQTREGMRTAIATHIETGAPLRVLNKNLEPLFGKARANVIARTEVTRMYAEGNRIAYGQAGIRTVEWRTVRDANVDPICDDLQGQQMPLGQEQIVPPAHPRCRCWLAPVVEPIKPLPGEPVSSEAVADDLIANVRNIEGAATRVMRNAANRGSARLEGLEFRVKGKGSLSRKVADNMREHSTTPRDAGALKGDVLRYTMILEPKSYTNGIQIALEGLEVDGYRVVKFKNYWTGQPGAYRGVNANLISPNGTPLEVQFHIQRSFGIKNGRLHTLYEEYRLSTTLEARRAVLDSEMMALWNDVATPRGIRGFTTFTPQAPRIPGSTIFEDPTLIPEFSGLFTLEQQ